MEASRSGNILFLFFLLTILLVQKIQKLIKRTFLFFVKFSHGLITWVKFGPLKYTLKLHFQILIPPRIKLICKLYFSSFYRDIHFQSFAYISAFKHKIKLGKCHIRSEKTCMEYTCEVSFFVQYIFPVSNLSNKDLKYDKNLIIITKCIELSGNVDPVHPMSQIKLTALVPADFCVSFSFFFSPSYYGRQLDVSFFPMHCAIKWKCLYRCISLNIYLCIFFHKSLHTH